MTVDRATHFGRCHCGNLEVAFETALPPERVSVRRCTCSFCLSHAALSISDPEGHIRFTVQDPARLSRYRFGLKTADFLVCRDCGVYMGAVLDEAGARYAIVNLNVLDDRDAFTQEPVPVSYDSEDVAGRRARRTEKWSPATEEIGSNA